MNDTYQTRKAFANDTAEVFALLRSHIGLPGCTWNDRYPTVDRVKEDVARGDAYVICDENGRIAAYGTIEPGDYVRGVPCFDDTPSNWCTIGRVAVAHDLHGRGLGRAIVKALLDEIAARGIDGVRLLVGANNFAAMHLYEKCEFKYCGEYDAFDVHWKCYENVKNRKAENAISLYPLKLAPVVKEIVWGGVKLAAGYHKPLTGKNIAESWELTVRPDGMSVIENGVYAGQTLAAFLGADAARFPLLIKLIDAKSDLSIQVHPDDAYAAEHEGEYGKTEMWYIVEADPGATLIYGVKNYSPEAFRQAIEAENAEEKKVERFMNCVSVKAGDVFFIPSGLVHAIGGGILIAEIQQSSNVTYRVYDYNRRPARQLHIDQALDVIVDWKEDEIEAARYAEIDKTTREGLLAACKYFTVHRYEVRGQRVIPSSTGFYHVLCLSGKGKLCAVKSDGSQDKPCEMCAGDSYFLPIGIGDVMLDGYFDVIVSEV